MDPSTISVGESEDGAHMSHQGSKGVLSCLWGNQQQDCEIVLLNKDPPSLWSTSGLGSRSLSVAGQSWQRWD